MALITLNNAQLAFGHVPLLDHCDFSLENNDRVGLIGRNGTGKSSLLKALAAIHTLDDGTLYRQNGIKFHYVAQEAIFEGNITVFDAVSQSLKHIQSLIEQYSAQEGDLAHLQAQIEQYDGWNWQNRVHHTLQKLCLPSDALINSLSGGMKKRVALAQALVNHPDVLLLDEPTNHLDLAGIDWLIDLLKAFKGSFIVVTHDRHFLNAVCTRIVELDRGKLLNFQGNFEDYQATKSIQLENEATVSAKFDKLLAQEEIWIRKGVEARRTRSQSRIERLHKLRAARAQRRQALSSVKMDVNAGVQSGKLVAQLDNVTFAYGGSTPVVRDFSTIVLRGDKIGLIGENGAGKTTLLKLLLGQLQPTHGNARLGTNLTIAYFDQMRAQLDLNATLADFISPGSEWIEIGQDRKHVNSYLNDFLFSPARANSPVRTLSGGERNRLLLARLFARPANILILDEPTNDLDIDTLELLEELLQNYSGTLFLVSHDRAFINHVVTSTLVHQGNGIWLDFEGDLNDYEEQNKRFQSKNINNKALNNGLSSENTEKSSKQNENTSKNNNNSTVKSTEPNKTSRKLSYKEQRELDALPAHIDALEAEQRDIQAQLANGALYATDHALAIALQTRDTEIEEALLQALQRWEDLQNPSI